MDWQTVEGEAFNDADAHAAGQGPWATTRENSNSKVRDLPLGRVGPQRRSCWPSRKCGLMGVREEYAKQQPLKGLKIVGCCT